MRVQEALDELRVMTFSTHDVVISGGKLDTLLADITAQRLNLLKEPVRAEGIHFFLLAQDIKPI